MIFLIPQVIGINDPRRYIPLVVDYGKYPAYYDYYQYLFDILFDIIRKT